MLNNPLHSANVKIVYHECIGGDLNCSSGLAPKVGPLGFSPKQVAEEIAKETSDEWRGLPVTVKITTQYDKFRLEIIPSAKSLIIKGLDEVNGEVNGAYVDADEELRHAGNMPMSKLIDISRELRPRSTQRKLEGVIIEVLKACNALGCQVEGTHPEDIIDQIYNKEISLPQE